MFTPRNNTIGVDRGSTILKLVIDFMLLLAYYLENMENILDVTKFNMLLCK